MAWPEPRLTLAADVHEDTERAHTVFSVANAKVPGATVTIDPGDGTEYPLETEVGADGTASAEYRFSDPGHHTYTATARAPVEQLYGTWGELAADVPVWGQVPERFAEWADGDRTEEIATVTFTVDVGPATIWAVAIPDDPLPYIQINTWIGEEELVTRWTVTRSTSAGNADFNRPIYIRTSHPGAYTIEDHEAPLGEEVFYWLQVEYADGRPNVRVRSNVVSIQGTVGCFLTDPSTERTMAIELATWDERKWVARQSVLEVIGRRDPVVISDVHTDPSGTWTLLTRDEPALQRMYSILYASRIVLLRTQPASAIESVYAAVGDVTEARVSGRGEDWRRLTDVEIQEVAPVPATALEASTTWAQVAQFWATWGDLAEEMPSWQDVSEWNPADPTSLFYDDPPAEVTA